MFNSQLGYNENEYEDFDQDVAEQKAFDDGVKAGESGDEYAQCPYLDSDAIEAWEAGYSVGSMNREDGKDGRV